MINLQENYVAKLGFQLVTPGSAVRPTASPAEYVENMWKSYKTACIFYLFTLGQIENMCV